MDVRRSWVPLLFVFGTALSARAQEGTPPARSLDGPFEATLWLENDNLMVGLYGDIAGRHLDGSDLGRTHAVGLAMGWDVADRIALRLELSSALFTRNLEPVTTYDSANIPVVFNEIDVLRTRVELRDPARGLRMGWSLGGLLHNHETVSIGSTGQQRLYHQVVRDAINPRLWQFVYLHDGRGILAGGVGSAWIGVTRSIFAAPWLRLGVRGTAELELNTIWAGSALRVDVNMHVALGDPRLAMFVLTAGAEAYGWLASGTVLVRTTIEGRLESEPIDFWIAIHSYQGDANAAYFAYTFDNVTMTVGLTVRI